MGFTLVGFLSPEKFMRDGHCFWSNSGGASGATRGEFLEDGLKVFPGWFESKLKRLVTISIY